MCRLCAGGWALPHISMHSHPHGDQHGADAEPRTRCVRCSCFRNASSPSAAALSRSPIQSVSSNFFALKSYSFVDSTARLPSGATTASPTRVMPTSAAPSSSRAVDGAGGCGRVGSREASFAADGALRAVVDMASAAMRKIDMRTTDILMLLSLGCSSV